MLVRDSGFHDVAIRPVALADIGERTSHAVQFGCRFIVSAEHTVYHRYGFSAGDVLLRSEGAVRIAAD